MKPRYDSLCVVTRNRRCAVNGLVVVPFKGMDDAALTLIDIATLIVLGRPAAIRLPQGPSPTLVAHFELYAFVNALRESISKVDFCSTQIYLAATSAPTPALSLVIFAVRQRIPHRRG